MQMLQTWDGWFEKDQPFIVIRQHVDDAALGQAEGTGKATKAWMRNGAADQIKKHVRAMCMIVPTNCAAAEKKPSVEAVFGVPGGIFTSLADALDWLEDHDWFGFDRPDRESLLAKYC
jgi:hypothetical protein